MIRLLHRTSPAVFPCLRQIRKLSAWPDLYRNAGPGIGSYNCLRTIQTRPERVYGSFSPIFYHIDFFFKGKIFIVKPSLVLI